MTVEVYFDGLCEPVNPGGVAAYGFVVYKDGRKIHSGKGVVGAGALGDDVTNNVAEYTALIKALEWLVEKGLENEEIVIKGDSQLVVKQLKGEYAVRSPRLVPLYRRVVKLAKKFRKLRFEWVPRGENWEADKLSREAYREFMDRHPRIREFYLARRKFKKRRGLERL